jgi:hypothetical protein
MKKLILFITFITLSYSCSSSDSSSSNNNGNAFTNSIDYEFTITINGEIHKVKGNTNNIVPEFSNNICLAQNIGQTVVTLSTNDVSASNYISGQNIRCQLDFFNLLLGTSQANVYLTSPYLNTLANNLGATSSTWSSAAGTQQTSPIQHLPFTITDLGTTSNLTTPPQSFGATLKGNYSGTIYLSDHATVIGSAVYDIPVQLSIDFKALRKY